ncbi:MAG: GNAT family N-acetyltransferase [Sphingobacteriaceae bacterium]|nr:GNAT family N-acetyltransferase [Sphingobacteriaceae bacterium]
MAQEITIDGILYSDDKALLQLDVIHNYLSKESYWSKGVPVEIVKRAMDGSICFAAYDNGKQIAYARIITDGATFGYLADVFVLEPYRGKGISKNLMKFIMDYPSFKGFRRFMLATKDAHSLYEKFGFKKLSTPDRFMEIKPFEEYKSK